MSVFQTEEVVLGGIGASPGIEYGPAFVYLQKELEVPFYQIEKKQIQAEIERFKSAIAMTKQQLTGIKQEITQKLSLYEANIFDAHLLMLEDKSLMQETLDYFYTNRCNIAYCFDAIVKRFLEQFASIGDENLKEKCVDLKDIAKRVLQNLLGHKVSNLNTLLVEPRIVVSEDFDPSEVVYFSKKRIMALITDGGSCTSHAVIMARSLGIPSIVGLKNASSKIENGDFLLIDGYEGRVVLNPSQATLRHYGQLTEHRRHVQQVFEANFNAPVQTKDGTSIELWINLDRVAQSEHLKQLDVRGVGLFRTENLFLKEEQFPSEEEQFRIYRALAEKAFPLPVTIRTIDIGGDKCPKHLASMSQENNPFLGFRAIRFCLENAFVFKQQLRAILRASNYGNVRLLYPMITSVQEIVKANLFLEECKQMLAEEGVLFKRDMPIGAMIEVPSAALILDFIASHCDFFSIGTNDLVQYLVAVDRVNERIAHLYEPTHPAVLRLLKQLVEESRRVQKPLHLCGEMGSEPIYIPLLIGLGLRSFSIHLDKLAEIKYLIRQLTLEEVQNLLHQALSFQEAKESFLLFRGFYLKKLNEISGRGV